MLTDALHNDYLHALLERNMRLRKIVAAVNRLETGESIVDLCREAVAWQERVDEIKAEIKK